ncbi:MAG: flavin reductase family protein [Clostridia bacterium]|nr:flavin reductase family protein [Clostridia bacterium]
MKTEWKGGTLLAPVPAVMVTVGGRENANIITIGWTGIINSEPPKTYISVRPERYSHDLLMETKEFVINLVPASMAEACDYCGMVTGRKVNKWEKCGLTMENASAVATPRIAECPMALECRVTDILHLGTHDMFMADIVKVALDESLLDEEGRLDMARANLCCYGHGTYYAVGDMLGRFGFSMADKKNGRGASAASAKSAPVRQYRKK